MKSGQIGTPIQLPDTKRTAAKAFSRPEGARTVVNAAAARREPRPIAGA
jgi:hypothetical protein